VCLHRLATGGYVQPVAIRCYFLCPLCLCVSPFLDWNAARINTLRAWRLGEKPSSSDPGCCPGSGALPQRRKARADRRCATWGPSPLSVNALSNNYPFLCFWNFAPRRNNHNGKYWHYQRIFDSMREIHDSLAPASFDDLTK